MLQWNTTCVQMTDFGKRLLYYDVEYTFKAFTSYIESDKTDTQKKKKKDERNNFDRECSKLWQKSVSSLISGK